MKYKLGAVVTVQGIKGIISYINAGVAFVTPIENGEVYRNSVRVHIKGCVFAKLGPKAKQITLV